MNNVMKTTLVLFFSLFITACSCRPPRKGETLSAHNDIIGHPISVGLLKINMFQDTLSHTIPIFSTNGNVADSIVYHSDSVTVNQTFRNHIRFFYPEYGLVYFDVDSVDKVNFRYYLDRKNYYVVHDSATVLFSWNDFLQTVLIEPFDDQELFSGPEQTNHSLFPGKGMKFVYSCDSVIGDWIHVKSDTVCIPSQTSFFRQGWMRWKIGDSLVISVFLDC